MAGPATLDPENTPLTPKEGTAVTPTPLEQMGYVEPDPNRLAPDAIDAPGRTDPFQGRQDLMQGAGGGLSAPPRQDNAAMRRNEIQKNPANTSSKPATTGLADDIKTGQDTARYLATGPKGYAEGIARLATDKEYRRKLMKVGGQFLTPKRGIIIAAAIVLIALAFLIGWLIFHSRMGDPAPATSGVYLTESYGNSVGGEPVVGPGCKKYTKADRAYPVKFTFNIIGDPTELKSNGYTTVEGTGGLTPRFYPLDMYVGATSPSFHLPGGNTTAARTVQQYAGLAGHINAHDSHYNVSDSPFNRNDYVVIPDLEKLSSVNPDGGAIDFKLVDVGGDFQAASDLFHFDVEISPAWGTPKGGGTLDPSKAPSGLANFFAHGDDHDIYVGPTCNQRTAVTTNVTPTVAGSSLPSQLFSLPIDKDKFRGENAHSHDCSVSVPEGCDQSNKNGPKPPSGIWGHRPMLGSFPAAGASLDIDHSVKVGEAVDLISPAGTPVRAPFTGTIVKSGSTYAGAPINDHYLIIESPDKRYIIVLMHLKGSGAGGSVPPKGTVVTRGSEISGVTTGMGDLHIELWVDGKPVNVGLGGTGPKIWAVMSQYFDLTK